MKQRIIVCSAIKKNDVIIIGIRHFDAFMISQIKALNENYSQWNQGFIDQFGVFMDRKEAWKIANESKQIRRPTGLEENYREQLGSLETEGILFSENLY